MFENLSERLERSFKILKGEGKITELNVAATMKDIRKALMEADVSYNVAKTFTNEVKDRQINMFTIKLHSPINCDCKSTKKFVYIKKKK